MKTVSNPTLVNGYIEYQDVRVKTVEGTLQVGSVTWGGGAPAHGYCYSIPTSAQ